MAEETRFIEYQKAKRQFKEASEEKSSFFQFCTIINQIKQTALRPNNF